MQRLPGWLPIGALAFLGLTFWAVGPSAALRRPDAPVGGPLTPTPAPSATPGCPLAWRIVDSPVSAAYDYLTGVVAIAADDAWSVGFSVTGSTERTLTLHWDGGAWRNVPAPNIGLDDNTLAAGAASPAGAVWAVGRYRDYHRSGLYRTLILRWDGQQWHVVASPNAGDHDNGLTGVTVVAEDDVWAVGYYSVGITAYPLVLHWDGTAWSVVPTPASGVIPGYLNGVAHAGAGAVWAAGLRPTANGYGTLIMAWNGLAWRVVAAPTPGDRSALRGIAALAANDVWAVGFYDNGGVNQTLTLHWDGNSWSVVSSPNVIPGRNYLNAVSAVAANDVWAGGLLEEGNRQALLEHWDGTRWHIVEIPNPGSIDYYLQGVAARTADDVWVVGSYYGPPFHALVERYSRVCTTPTPAPTATACPVQFSDVPTTHPFYPFIRCLACRGVVSGYADNTFRPASDVTRGQLAKIIANAAQFTDPVPSAQQTFADVAPGSTYWLWVERLAGRAVVSGYACGGPGEPCDPALRPYYRPAANATRAQIAKIAARAAGLADQIPSTQQTFADVPPAHPFWLPIEQLGGRTIISGYQCGGPGEPCDAQTRPYFRPGANTTRGQMTKIAANTFFPGCQTRATSDE